MNATKQVTGATAIDIGMQPLTREILDNIFVGKDFFFFENIVH